MLKKTTSKSINNISKRKLSIQFSLDGFSFSISNELDEVFLFSSFSFDNALNTPQELQEQIEQIFKSEKQLHEEFHEVLVIHQNRLNTFVPKPFFKEENLSNYLDYTVKTLANDLIVFDQIDDLDTVNVYIPYVNINNYLFQNFGEFEFKHHSSVLVEKLQNYCTTENTELFAIVESNTLSVYGYTNKEFTFYNAFEITSEEDFIYYLLFVIEQLKLNTEEVNLWLSGNFNKDSKYYKIAYTYIRHVDFLNAPKNLLHENNKFENHSNIALLG